MAGVPPLAVSDAERPGRVVRHVEAELRRGLRLYTVLEEPALRRELEDAAVVEALASDRRILAAIDAKAR